MNMKLVLVLLGSLFSAVAAESIRETELMDPNGIIDGLIEASGADDEDLYNDYDENYDENSDSFDESGDYSGDSEDDDDDETEDDLESTMDTPTTTLGNHIEGDKPHKPKINTEVIQLENDIAISREINPDENEPSNRISMAITSNGFFSRTEVVIAVVAGGVVGLVFAVIIVLLVMRVRKNKKGDIAYDTVKKPIYKKAPTIEA